MPRGKRFVDEFAPPIDVVVAQPVAPDVADLPRADLPALLAKAKAAGDSELVAAILARCAE